MAADRGVCRCFVPRRFAAENGAGASAELLRLAKENSRG